MSDPFEHGVLEEAPPEDSPAGDESMAELRSLLLGPAEVQIAEIHARLADPHRQLKEVSQVLPAAVSVRSRADDELSEALAPTITSSIERAVRKNPQPLVDAISPVMGPAIRKAIADALSVMMQALNQGLAHSLSVQGLKWRLESWRTGIPFTKVVMLHTLVYSVEQVFLIHRETGIVLQHVVAEGVEALDADMISGMLTALQDFMHDSFEAQQGGSSEAQQGGQLENFKVGDLTMWVEQGPLALLAGLIRGTAPQELREVFRTTIENIHLQYHDALANFSGDSADFDRARPLLEDCLKSQHGAQQQAGAARRKPIPLIVISSLIILALLLWAFFAWRNARRWDYYVESLKREPGIVVTEAGKSGGKYFVNGLRDPLSRDPATLMPEAKVDPADVVGRWQPFQALSPEFVLARAQKLLAPPPTVKLSVDNGVLEAEGFASRQWITEARNAVRFIPGLNQFKEDELLDLDRIENPLLLFELDQTQLVPGQEEKLQQLVADIERLQTLAQAMNKNVRLEITGHADSSGTEDRNTELTKGRAEVVAGAINARLSSKINLVITPHGTMEKLRDELTEADRATNRSVTFKIILTDA